MPTTAFLQEQIYLNSSCPSGKFCGDSFFIRKNTMRAAYTRQLSHQNSCQNEFSIVLSISIFYKKFLLVFFHFLSMKASNLSYYYSIIISDWYEIFLEKSFEIVSMKQNTIKFLERYTII